MEGRRLRKLFDEFNLKYFNARLPAYAIRVVDHITWFGESGTCNRRRRIIRIDSGMDDATCVSTLLHEMAHAATADIHGNRWKAEMIRLRDAGAPFIAPDDCVKMEDWSGGRVTKDQFSGAARDILIEIPTATARQIIRFFINNEGGPAATVAEFLRKYPWATRVCGALKKERAECAKARDAFLAEGQTARAVLLESPGSIPARATGIE